MSSIVRDSLENYFSSMNATSKRFMDDIKQFQANHGNDWKKFSSEEQSKILWQSIVSSDIEKTYEHVPKEDLGIEVFPVLKTRPGGKLIVEEGCSWRDEHSAPFMWKTQSQLDLRINAKYMGDEKLKIEKSKSSSQIDEESKKDAEQEKKGLRKDDEIKRSNLSIKRPDVPPPPIPKHVDQSPLPAALSVPFIQSHAEAAPILREKDDTPIYAKVMKRKSGSSKTLAISELKAHRKAREDKPDIPPRMSLELRGDVNMTKYKTLPINFDGIPKTGFDFLDNW